MSSTLPSKPIFKKTHQPIDINNPTTKRAKLYNSRQIRTEVSDPSFTNPNASNSNKQIINANNIANKLSVPSFVHSRSFEIKEFEKSQLRSKHSSATRVFQSLPRSMRRRTASHNVRRIPSRMRGKALREMGLWGKKTGAGKETKGVTGTGKPVDKKHPRGRILWKLKRTEKLLKYAGKTKIQGKLLDGDWVNVRGLKLRDKLKNIKEEIEKLKKNNEIVSNIENDAENDDTNAEVERNAMNRLIWKLNNKIGSYDNTSINEPAKIHKVSSLKYSTRQRKFKWLPTHVWHAKRAKMIKRWGWNIVNEPTMKCFRSTSRSSRIKGCIAWDNSYVNTIVINCYDNDALLQLINLVGEMTKNKATLNKFIKGSVSWEGFIYAHEQILGRATIIWITNIAKPQLIIRIHPSIQKVVHSFLLSSFKNYKNITIHDCKYSIGSIKIRGPKALSSIQSILHSSDYQESYTTFLKLTKLQDLSTIPVGTIFTFNAMDPRFHTTNKLPASQKLTTDELLTLISTLKAKSLSQESLTQLFSIEGRTLSYKNQSSLKDLGRRRHLNPGVPIQPIPSDPTIPILIYRASDGWQLLIPWFWTLPFWLSLVHIPHVQIGGLKQTKQLSFEDGKLGFSDLVFTTEGYLQCELEKEFNEKKWLKRPKGKRVEYHKLILGDEKGELLSPFGLDWRGLQTLRAGLKCVKPNTVETIKPMFDKKMNRIVNSTKNVVELVRDIALAEKQFKKINKQIELLENLPIKLVRLKDNAEINLDNVSFTIQGLPQLPVIAIKIICTTKGNLQDNSKIYQIPESHYEEWVSYGNGKVKTVTGKNVSSEELGVPTVDNLIGLVTSSTYNLSKGCSSGVGYLDAEMAGQLITLKNKFLLVRNTGSHLCHLVSWEEVEVELV